MDRGWPCGRGRIVRRKRGLSVLLLSRVMVTHMSGRDDRPDPYQAFRRGRLAVDRHVSRVLQAGEMWAEETATDILLAEASPDVSYWKFTKKRENAVGADWLWWWIDATGTSFGLLARPRSSSARAQVGTSTSTTAPRRRRSRRSTRSLSRPERLIFLRPTLCTAAVPPIVTDSTAGLPTSTGVAAVTASEPVCRSCPASFPSTSSHGWAETLRLRCFTGRCRWRT